MIINTIDKNQIPSGKLFTEIIDKKCFYKDENYEIMLKDKHETEDSKALGDLMMINGYWINKFNEKKLMKKIESYKFSSSIHISSATSYKSFLCILVISSILKHHSWE